MNKKKPLDQCLQYLKDNQIDIQEIGQYYVLFQYANREFAISVCMEDYQRFQITMHIPYQKEESDYHSTLETINNLNAVNIIQTVLEEEEEQISLCFYLLLTDDNVYSVLDKYFFECLSDMLEVEKSFYAEVQERTLMNDIINKMNRDETLELLRHIAERNEE